MIPHLVDVPLETGESPFDEYDGAIPEFTGDEVEGAFPTMMHEAPIPPEAIPPVPARQVAEELLKAPAYLRSTHDIARWILARWPA